MKTMTMMMTAMKAGTDTGESVVKDLMKPFKNRGHCVTADNFFTSFDLIVELFYIKTTFIGTIRRNKRELPILVKKKQAVYLSCFLENDKGSNCLSGKKRKKCSYYELIPRKSHDR